MFDEGPHGISVADKMSARNDSDINKAIHRWVKLSVEFLNKYMNV